MRFGPCRKARLSPLVVPAVVVAVAVLSSCADTGEHVAEQEPPTVDLALMEARVAARIEEARSAVERQPESAAAWGTLARVFHAHELFPQAVYCYRVALDRETTDPIWPYLGALAARQSDLGEALELFAVAAERGADHAAFHIHYGNSLIEAGRIEEAEARYRRALELAPDASHARYGLAQTAMFVGDTERARSLLEEAAAQDPRNGEVHRLLAQLYRQQGLDAAAERAERRFQAYPGARPLPDPIAQSVEEEAVNSRSFTQRGLEAANRGDWRRAEKAFRQVIEIRPPSAQDLSNLAGTLVRQGRTTEAVELYRQALGMEPESAHTKSSLGIVLAGLGRHAEALALLREAVREEPLVAELHFNLGHVLALSGNVSEAIEQYREAIRLHPGLVAAYLDLGTALARAGRPDEAMLQWEVALELDPGNLMALSNLAATRSQAGEHAAAVKLLERAVALAPGDPRILSLLAWELATSPDSELRDGPRAVALARRLVERSPTDPAALDTLAAALAESGDFEAAVAAATRALELGASRSWPGTTEAKMRLSLYQRRRPYHSE